MKTIKPLIIVVAGIVLMHKLDRFEIKSQPYNVLSIGNKSIILDSTGRVTIKKDTCIINFN